MHEHIRTYPHAWRKHLVGELTNQTKVTLGGRDCTLRLDPRRTFVHTSISCWPAFLFTKPLVQTDSKLRSPTEKAFLSSVKIYFVLFGEFYNLLERLQGAALFPTIATHLFLCIWVDHDYIVLQNTYRPTTHNYKCCEYVSIN